MINKEKRHGMFRAIPEEIPGNKGIERKERLYESMEREKEGTDLQLR